MGELDEKQIRKNDFLVTKKITEVDVFGKDPFCRVNVADVNVKMAKDKSEAIKVYREEAADRLFKKINVKATKKEIVKNENYLELIERQKKEALKKTEIENQKSKNDSNSMLLSQSKLGTINRFAVRRFSNLQSVGALSLALESFAMDKAFNAEGMSTDRPLKNLKSGHTSPNAQAVKQTYKKGEFIPNLHTLAEEEKRRNIPKDQLQKPKLYSVVTLGKSSTIRCP